MIILGISGLEDRSPASAKHLYASPANSVESLLTFSDYSVPLQFFPLRLLGHDSSAALIIDGQMVAFGAEERFSRVKHGFNLAGRTVWPRRATAFCLAHARISWDEIDYVSHYCRFTKEGVSRRLAQVSRDLNLEDRARLAGEYEEAFEKRLAREVILEQVERMAGRAIPADRLIQVKHHLAHAAGAFFSSDFDESLILTVDGYGEEESSLWAIGQGCKIYPQDDIKLPTSLGFLYQLVTAYLGFRSFGDEYKVMGLASYGDPKVYRSVFRDFVEQGNDGRYRMKNLSRPNLFFRLRDHFGEPFRDEGFVKKKADIAAALQETLEETLLSQLSALRIRTGARNLCLSGGVGLNACANSAIVRSRIFENVFITPAAGDDGTSLGAALYAQHEILRADHRRPVVHAFWGPAYDSIDIERALEEYPQVRWERHAHIEAIAAKMLDEGKIVGWFQGRMEMGPRALGARSILADPRAPDLRDKINAKIKRREAFRPFAPSILEEEACRYFEIPPGMRSPFMLITFRTLEHQRSRIPAVIHVDGTSRIQTVGPDDNPRFYRLLQCFFQKTGIPALLNTSFNMAGEPIVNSPQDALRCFFKSGTDVLVIEDYLIVKRSDQV